jgi:Tol biopolymer transport system component
LQALQVPALHGDWALALKFGEVWAIPVSGGATVQIARYVDRIDKTISYPNFDVQANELRRQLTPDGRRLVLSVGEDLSGTPRYRLAVVDLDGGALRQVVRDDADLIRPAISPDGTKIAYVRRFPTGSTDRFVDDGLWVVNVDGTGARRLAPGAAGLFTWIFGWTPDSKGVIFDTLEWSAGPLVIDVASGTRTLVGGFVPRDWLALGNDFAFRTGRSPSIVAGLSSKAFQGEYSIVVANRAGDPQRTLVAEGNTFFLLGAPRWNPKTDEILYRHVMRLNEMEFFVADLTGAHTRVPLAVRPYLADWTSDGAGIVYLSQDITPEDFSKVGASLARAVRIAKRDGSADRELFSFSGGGLSDLVVIGYP